MSTLMWAVCAVCVIAALVLMFLEKRRSSKQILAMHKMRGSRMYADIYHQVVEKARGEDIEELRVERDRVVVIGVWPRTRIAEFDLNRNGYQLMSGDKVRALANVLALDLPQLDSVRDYEFDRIQLERPSGDKDYAYMFVIRSAAKKKITERHRRMSWDRLY
ncbi:MAG: hypothetical protein IKP22_15815 [Clostridia bacterium]|nr:hypothetical protein [Clostridia bacterium]